MKKIFIIPSIRNFPHLPASSAGYEHESTAFEKSEENQKIIEGKWRNIGHHHQSEKSIEKKSRRLRPSKINREENQWKRRKCFEKKKKKKQKGPSKIHLWHNVVINRNNQKHRHQWLKFGMYGLHRKSNHRKRENENNQLHVKEENREEENQWPRRRSNRKSKWRSNQRNQSIIGIISMEKWRKWKAIEIAHHIGGNKRRNLKNQRSWKSKRNRRKPEEKGRKKKSKHQHQSKWLPLSSIKIEIEEERHPTAWRK